MNSHMNIPKSFKEAGIEEEEFLAKVDMLADRAFEDRMYNNKSKITFS